MKAEPHLEDRQPHRDNPIAVEQHCLTGADRRGQMYPAGGIGAMPRCKLTAANNDTCEST